MQNIAKRSARTFWALAMSAVLAACGHVERPAATRAETTRAPVRETAQCEADLTRMGVAFRALPDHDYGPGCSVSGAVQLVDIGVPVTGITAMRCGEARAFASWTRGAVAPAAYQMLGSELARVEGMGSYACRNVIGSAGNTNRRSGHAIANAVDVGGVVLKDGRRITILNDWNSPDPQVRGFLQTIHASACRRFGTVLSPDYNAVHRNHLHLEDDHAGMCR